MTYFSHQSISKRILKKIAVNRTLSNFIGSNNIEKTNILKFSLFLRNINFRLFCSILNKGRSKISYRLYLLPFSAKKIYSKRLFFSILVQLYENVYCISFNFLNYHIYFMIVFTRRLYNVISLILFHLQILQNVNIV